MTTAVYLLNRATTKSVSGMTPYEAWCGRRPNVQHLRTFGCVAHVKVTRPNTKKLDDRSVPMVFLGYEPGSAAYRVFHPPSGRAHVSRDVVFDENTSWDWGATSPAREEGLESFTVKLEPVATTSVRVEAASSPIGRHTEPAPDAEPSSPQSAIAAPTPTSPAYGTPISTPTGVEHTSPPSGASEALPGAEAPRRYRTLENLWDTTEEVEANYSDSEMCMLVGEEPASFAEAETDQGWRAAMDEEMSSITTNRTWELSDLPAGHRPIGLKLVYKLKKDPQGAIVKHKARLVAKGYMQREGVDFEEVFAPVAHMDSVHVLVALAAHHGWQVHHMDVKSAFLNGDLLEEVYVQQPPGYAVTGQEGKVFRLRKALYGLRQASRAWNA